MKNNKCPSTGKTIFPSYRIGIENMLKIKSHNSLSRNNFSIGRRSTGKSKQKRVYFCEHCKGFHLTSIENIRVEYKRHKILNDKKKKYFASIDIEKWKSNSIPFEQGHIPPPKIK